MKTDKRKVHNLNQKQIDSLPILPRLEEHLETCRVKRTKVNDATMDSCFRLLALFSALPDHKIDTLYRFVGAPKEIPQNEPKVEVMDVITFMCDAMEIEYKILKAKTRRREICQKRQFLQHFLVNNSAIKIYEKKYFRLGLQQIANLTGVDNHATVLSSVKAIQNLKDTSPTFRQYCGNIEGQVKLKFGI